MQVNDNEPSKREEFLAVMNHMATATPSDQAGVVFVTYNGLLDPLGPSQIVPYMERIREDRPVFFLSFERSEKLENTKLLGSMQKRLAAQGISWTYLRYHKRPSLPATTWDVMAGVRVLRELLRTKPIGIVHARGYVPMAIATSAAGATPILFDIRGLQAEEYVDGGIWRQGELKWKLAKWYERKFFRRANGAVVLTENILPYIRDQFLVTGRRPPVAVIPCCVDLKRFQFRKEARVRIRHHLRLSEATIAFIYSGSLGTWYQAQEMADYVYQFRRETGLPVCLLWMVNGDMEQAEAVSKKAGLVTDQYRIFQASHDQVVDYLSAADVGLALIRPCFSKRSSSPTKYAEYLAMGLPLLLQEDIGDGRNLVDRNVAITPDSGSFVRLLEMRKLPRAYFREVAEELFQIDKVAMPVYRDLYATLLS